jgi:uncharacterized protein involved in response to NO
MKDQAIVTVKDWLTLALTGLGITFAPHHFLGGLFLALAGAAFARSMSPEQDERELWVVFLGAFLAGVLAAELASVFIPDFPVQIVMAAAGFFSRYLARFALRVAGLVEQRADNITDRVIDRVLPGDKEDEK